MRYFLLIFLFIPGVLFANNQSKTDSLKNLLPKSKGNNKLEILQILSRQYLFQSSDSCIKYGTLAMHLAQELQDIEQEAIACKRMGYSCYRIGDYDHSISYYERALESFLEEKQYLDAAVITNFLGSVYTLKSDYSKAISYLVLAEKSCDTLIRNDSIQTSVKRLYAILYTNFGIVYHSLDSIQKPLDYFNRALHYAEEIKDSNRIAASHSNIGMMYKAMNKFDLAYPEYLKALKISQAIGNRDYEKATLNNIASMYFNQEIYDSALIYYMKALSLVKETGDKYGLSLINRNIASIYLKEGNYKLAFENAYRALEYSQEVASLQEIYSNYELLSEIFKSTGDYKQALYYYTHYTALKDSVSGAETRENIADIQTKYETEKKEKENLLLKKDIEIEKRKSDSLKILAIILIIAGMVSLMLFYFIRKNAINKKKLAESVAARLEDKVAHQKRELASSTLTLSRNLEFINSLIEDIEVISKQVNNDKVYASINRLIKKLEHQNSDKYWEEFETRFQEIHRHFYQKLHENFVGLTPNEVKLCALLKMGMNTKEICSVTFQSVRAVEAARLRLRKKLKMKNEENLAIFLQRF
jgi:tetratricopeptide (TPR) repeat protein